MTGRPSSLTLYQRAERLVGLDFRALAVFRILAGLILLADVAVRATALEAHYTDFGVLPRAAHAVYYAGDWVLSLNMLSGAWWWQAVLLAALALAAVCLTLGYRTRPATVAAWVLLLGFHWRNPLVIDRGDALLLNLLLWLIFLPAGARYAMDVRQGRTEARAGYVLLAGSLGILLQVCFIYWFTVVFKDGPAWRVDGSALTIALNLDPWTKPLGALITELPFPVQQGLTFGTLYLELLGPVLAFIPVWIGFWRTLAVGVFVGFHLGLALTLALGTFPFVCMAAWVLFLPAPFWDRLAGTGAGAWLRGRWHCLAGRRARPEPLDPNAALGPADIAAQIACILLLFYGLSQNLNTSGMMGRAYYETVFTWAGPVGRSIRFDQEWSMFSLGTLRTDGWFIIEARFDSGRSYDLFSQSAVTLVRPERIDATFKNQRWRKYFQHVADKSRYADDLAAYFARIGEREVANGERLVEVRVVYMREELKPDFTSTPVEAVVLARATP